MSAARPLPRLMPHTAGRTQVGSAMARVFFWIGLALFLRGEGRAAGYAVSGSLYCVIGWILFGPSKRIPWL